MNVDKILIEEDDAAIAQMVQTRLEREGFQVQWAADGKQGFDAVGIFNPSLILLDLTMPPMSGLEVCRKLRQEENTRSIPIIMVTANSDDTDVTLGLELGADDYVAKPFSVRQLVARIRAVLRRAVPNGKIEANVDELTIGGICLNQRTREVKVHNQLVALTVTEFDILWHMGKECGKVFSREELLERLQRQDDSLVKRNIDVHVMTLRKKLGEEGPRIMTVRGIGYKLRG